jgi:DNA-binding MarR family transcriptional regulator
MRWRTSIVMDRATLSRDIVPLERQGPISIVPGRTDRRSKELRLTEAGAGRLQAARDGWGEAQTRFAAAFGEERTAGRRAFPREVSATDLLGCARRERLNEAIRNDQPDATQFESLGANRSIYALFGSTSGAETAKEAAMSSISVEGATQTAPEPALTRQRLKWILLYAGFSMTERISISRRSLRI